MFRSRYTPIVSLVSNPPPLDFLHPRPIQIQGTAGQILNRATAAARTGHPIVIREICRDLSLTPGAPYSHFENSAHLEAVVMYNGFLEFGQAISAACAGIEHALEQLLVVCRAYREWALSNPAFFSFLLPTMPRPNESEFARHIEEASRVLAIPSALSLRRAWDEELIPQATPGPHALQLEIPDVVSLSPDESREANFLWVTVHGAVVLELSIGTHDGWAEADKVFDWMINSHVDHHLRRSSVNQ